jgi:hypothetical protein
MLRGIPVVCVDVLNCWYWIYSNVHRVSAIMISTLMNVAKIKKMRKLEINLKKLELCDVLITCVSNNLMYTCSLGGRLLIGIINTSGSVVQWRAHLC